MSRIKPVDQEQATGELTELFESLERQLGSVPNVFKVMAVSPQVLKAYLSMSRALTAAGIDPALREQIAVAVAGINKCDYCASAHTFVGRKRGVSDVELGLNLTGRSNDERTEIVLRLVDAILNRQGELTDAEFSALHDVGFSDREIIEMITYIGLSATANYLNKIAGTEIDFPLVNAGE